MPDQPSLPPEEQQYEAALPRDQAPNWWIIALALGSALAALLYRFLQHHNLGGTSAIFLGIPAVLATALAFTPRARTVTGGILKGITFLLLIVAPLLGEGWFCILFAAPLFYAVGLLIGLVADHFNKKRPTTVSCFALLLLPMCLEGVFPELTIPRAQTVSVTRVVPASSAAVEAALAQSPRLAHPLPLLLRIGFPVPLRAHGSGLAFGSRRTILFSGVEGAPAGELTVRASARGPGFVRFDTVSDRSKLRHWMRWQSSEVSWQPVDATHTRVTWTIHFDRQLDPAWYFMPLERAAVHEAARFMIASNATPADAAR